MVLDKNTLNDVNMFLEQMEKMFDMSLQQPNTNFAQKQGIKVLLKKLKKTKSKIEDELTL